MALKSFLIRAALVAGTQAIAAPDAPMITPPPSLAARHDGLAQRAIDPTESGQIGVNPVTSDLGDPATYQLTDLGPNNPVITISGNVYHYIEAHTKYLSIETITTSQDNKPVTTTSEVKVAASTAKADGQDQKNGDIAITFSQEVADALRKTADEAIAACQLVPKHKRALNKRLDSVQCIIDAAAEASGEGGPLEGAATAEFWESIAASVASNAPEALTAAYAVIKSQSQKKMFLIILASTLAAVNINEGPIATVNIPKEGVGKPKPKDDDPKKKCTGEEEVTKDSPVCQDKECSGNIDDPKPLCKVEPLKDCPCLIFDETHEGQAYDQKWWDEQQAVIESFKATPTLIGGKAAPSCFVNTHGKSFNGKDKADPASWCVCNEGGKSLLFGTMTSTDSPCAFTKMPTATISPKLTISANDDPVTSCRVESVKGTNGEKDTDPYCTCNDDKMHGWVSTTVDGKATSGCPAPTEAKATSTQGDGKPTPTCNADMKYTINQDIFKSAISTFCERSDRTLMQVPWYDDYVHAVTEYWSDPTYASEGGQLLMYAWPDKDSGNKQVNKDNCNKALESVFDKCDHKQGGAASINGQHYNITAIKGHCTVMKEDGTCNEPGAERPPGSYPGWPWCGKNC